MSGLPSDVTHFLSCGVDKVLLKPLDMEAFTRAMKRDDVADDDFIQDRTAQRDITENDFNMSQKSFSGYDGVL